MVRNPNLRSKRVKRVPLSEEMDGLGNRRRRGFGQTGKAEGKPSRETRESILKAGACSSCKVNAFKMDLMQ
ncbi:hypothetical protein SDC9_95473 [bioreactor metagenome]|uniref:Uncharacterized protein n=1 Tax=bioreactor metagenome TaxID=1076179 RepID=A0A645A747_9ZZZZ